MTTDKIELIGAPRDIVRIEVHAEAAGTAGVWATTASGSTRRVATLSKERYAALLGGGRLSLDAGETYQHAYDAGDVGCANPVEQLGGWVERCPRTAADVAADVAPVAWPGPTPTRQRESARVAGVLREQARLRERAAKAGVVPPTVAPLPHGDA